MTRKSIPHAHAACALAASLLVAACGGGGDASAPPAAAQTITFGAIASQTYGTAAPALNATASSGLPVTYTSLTTAYCSVSGSTLTLVAAGACQIKASQAGNASYAAAVDVTVPFAIAQAAQTITFPAPASQTLGTPAPALAATGGASGQAVTFASTTPAVCAVSGSSVTLVAAGDCSVTANQAGNANYAAAAATTASFKVTAAPVASGDTGTCTAAPCIDFASATVGLEAFEGLGSATVANDPSLAANKVAKFVKTSTGQPWAGATVYADGAAKTITAIDASKGITLRVYSPAVGEIVMVKLEGGAAGAANQEVQATTTKANAWETLSFTYTVGSYSKVSIFPGFMTQVDKTHYFDELKYTAAANVAPTAFKFASNYSQVDPSNLKSTEGGSAGRYIDETAGAADWWNGVASADATPSFYFGYGVKSATKPWGFGAFVKAPANGTANVAGYTNLRLAVWSNDELANTRPTYAVILKGPAAGACTPELQGSAKVTANGAQTYTLPLAGFTVKTPCSFGNAAAVLAAGVAEVHIQVLGANVQYVTSPADAPGFYANGLNVGPISFSN